MIIEKEVVFYILMPVYNCEKYVAKSIQSVLDQSYKNLHLICVNDGSTDTSGKICNEFASLDDRVTVIHKENEGLIATRRLAVKEVVLRQEKNKDENVYVLFLDSDDWLESDTLKVLNECILKKKYDCIIYGFVRVLQGKVVYKTEEFSGELDKREACKKICINTTYNSLCRKAVRFQSLPDIDYSKYYKIKLGEDKLQTLDILRKSESFLFISNHLYNYRYNEESMTNLINFDKHDYEYVPYSETLKFMKEMCYTNEEIDELIVSIYKILYGDISKILFSINSWKSKKKYLINLRNSSFLGEEIFPRKVYTGLSWKEKFMIKRLKNGNFLTLKIYYFLSKTVNKIRKKVKI